MTAQIISGKEVAEKIREELIPRIEKLKSKNMTPTLAAVVMGEDPGAMSYLKGIAKGCEKVGMNTETISLAPRASQRELEDTIKKLNNDCKFHGIIVQRPLPQHINENAVLGLLAIEKDVDCLSPLSMVKLVTKEPGGFAPCTRSSLAVAV